MIMDCLVTKLKAAVTNELLVPVGYVELFSLSGTNVELTSESGNFQLYNNSDSCKLLGDGYFISNGENVGKSFAFPANTQTPYAVHVNSGTVKVIAKYNSMRGSCMIRMESSNLKVNLDNFLLAKANGYTYSMFLFTGAITANVKNSCIWDAGYQNFTNYGGVGIVGNVKDIVKTNSNRPPSVTFRSHPYLIGNAEDLFDKYANAGASGQTVFNFYYCPNLFYQGEALDFKGVKINFSNGSWSEV